MLREFIDGIWRPVIFIEPPEGYFLDIKIGKCTIERAWRESGLWWRGDHNIGGNLIEGSPSWWRHHKPH